MNGLEITMELLHFGIFSLVRQLQFYFSTARGADKRTRRSPLVNHPGRGVPLLTPRRGRVPVKLKFEAIRRQGQGSKISPFRSALPAARRKSKGHLTP